MNKINILNKGKTKELCTYCGFHYSIANKTNHCRTIKHGKLQFAFFDDENNKA